MMLGFEKMKMWKFETYGQRILVSKAVTPGKQPYYYL